MHRALGGCARKPGCAPYLCDGSSPACPSLCLGDVDCDATHYCSGNQKCSPQKSQGVLCNDAAGGDCQTAGCRVCTTGNCVDGYCCDTACGGLCQACSATRKGSGVNGTCGAIASGSDPDSECATEAVSTCGQDGSCNGSGACSKYAVGTVCQAQSCANSTTQNNADTCDGSGTCIDNSTVSCAPYACTAGACVGGSCTSDSQCQSGYYCDASGTCQTKKSQGASCNTTTDCKQSGCGECATGNCVDGLCCDTACNGSCDACSVAAGATTDGTCALLASGMTGSPACAPFACNGLSAACPSLCLSDADCDATHYCASDQTCKPQKVQGSLCNTAAGGDCQGAGCRVCATGNCTDGYCCDTACNGPCEACSATKKGSGSSGTCGPVGAGTDPDDECIADTTSTCGRNGNCDGAGACALYASGTVCDPRTCSNGTTQSNADTCDGSGTCVDNGTTSCSPYACTGGACVGGACNADSDCQSGYYCASDDQCHTKKTQGESCDTTADCKGAGCAVCDSGNCVDGVCCDTACNGACDACAISAGAAADGTCSIQSSGAVGAPACAPYACDGSNAACPSSCVSDADCDAAHYCASDQTCKPKKVQGSICDGSAGADCFNTGCGVCQTGFCVDGFCCDSACDGLCQSCSSAAKGAGVNGECGVVADGTDPASDCAPYTCSAGACGSGCTGDADCGSGTVCITSSGTCVKPAGQGTACTANAGCQSGFCVDGVCCDTACTGQCEACDDVGSEGTCVAVKGDPHGNRTACDGDPAACGGQCNGTSRAQCTYPASGTTCGSPTCDSGSAKTFACDGQGSCAALAPVKCGEYACDTTACKTSCSGDSDCANGYACSSSTCVPSGAKCSDDLSQSIGSDGATKQCAPYLCSSTNGTCAISCADSSECADGNICDPASKACVPGSSGGGANGADQGGCGCRTAGDTRGSGAPWLIAFGLLALALRRRERDAATAS